jgi:DNA polymerase-3 subunit beta
MKVECVQNKLQEVLNQAEKIAGKNLNLPVLSCVLIEAKKGLLQIRSTNLDLGFQSSIPAKVDEEGVLAIPANVLSSIVSSISNEKNIKLESNELTLTVTSNKSKSNIKCFSSEDFPTIPEISNEQSFEIESHDFVKGLKSVSYSSSNSSIKPELSSVCVYSDDNNVVFAATDSFRLAEKKIKFKIGKEFDKILIPFKNIAEIMRILEKNPQSIEVRFNKHQIAFVFGGTYLTSRLIEGAFPDYQQIIPKEFKTEVVVLKEDLIRALKISTIFSDAFNQINLNIAPSEKKFQLTTKNTTLGENTTLIDSAMTGESNEVNFNFRYINDCLQSIDTDSISLSFSGPNRPVVIRGVSDKMFTYLVMPMNK